MYTNILKGVLPKVIIEMIDDYIGDIELTFDYGEYKYVNIKDSEFKDYNNRQHVVSVKVIRKLTIDCNTIFSGYIKLTKIEGVIPTITTLNLSSLFSITHISYIRYIPIINKTIKF